MRRVLAVALVGALGASVRGEDAPLTLAEAVAMAARQNPALLAARERAAAEEARAAAVADSRWPRLTLASSLSRTDNPSGVFSHKLDAGAFTQDDFAIDRLNDPGSISHLTTWAGLELPLDVFGKTSDAAQGQAAVGRAARALAREAALDARLRVVEAYHSAALARRAVEVSERAFDGARSREAETEARVQQGMLLEAELLRARTRRRRREAELADRRGEMATAAATLSRRLGAPPESTYVPSEAPGAPAPLVGDEGSWTARGLAGRPLIEVARERMEASRRRSRLEGRALLPDLVAYGRVQDDRNDASHGAQSYAVGLDVRWSAIDPGRGRREAAAAADLRAAEQDLRALTDQVRLEVASAYRHAQAAREHWSAAAGGSAEGREALRVVQERRRAGLATLTDELETEAAALAAELDESRAATQAAIADAALARSAGVDAASQVSGTPRGEQ